MHAVTHHFFKSPTRLGRAYRGRRAIEEATQRLNKAMDRADAELEAAQRNHRGSRYSHYGVNGADGQPANGDSGVHKLGRAAEHDYDRYHPVVISGSEMRKAPAAQTQLLPHM